MKLDLKKIKQFLLGIVNSYSQVFFSNHLIFSLFLVLVSFFDIYCGLFGLIAVLVSNLTAYSMGFDLGKISSGLYGFNSLLVGLGLGIYFEPGYLSIFILVISAIFTFFLSAVFEGVIGKYALPFLSIPFLFGIWSVSMATREFEELIISDRNIFVLNDMYKTGGQGLLDLYNWWQELPIWVSLKTYFRSLGAIFFQYNAISGVVIAVGLLLYSRIAFTLSLIGFYSAYIFYQQMGVNIEELSYAYIGFNYILTAIAIGGFFLIPSVSSYTWTIVLVPVVAMLTISMSYAFWKLRLPIYSLPFNIVVLMFLYVLKLRLSVPKRLIETPVQHFSPEKNLYHFKNAKQRFGESNKIPVKLPFMGEWKVTQAHDGEVTHKGEWKHAWDFEIVNDENQTYQNEGNEPEDYLCYNKPVLSPAYGYVEEVIDEIPDNKIGDMNVNHNWGNTIIIKHADFLYSKLCHIKPGSFKVKKGDFVKQGQVVASCGNSGRSPYPHLHFQLQSTPYIGSKTLDYPLSHYIINDKKQFGLRSFEKPNDGDLISNISHNEIISKAFKMIPGRSLEFSTSAGNVKWEVHTDVYNNSYIWCKKTRSMAYFYSDDDLFYFKNFSGKKSSLLYHFYLSVFKVQKGFYKEMKLHDEYPADLITNRFVLVLQDLIAPIWIMIKGKYELEYSEIDDENWPGEIRLTSSAVSGIFNKKLKHNSYQFTLDTKGIRSFTVETKKQKIEAQCIRS